MVAGDILSEKTLENMRNVGIVAYAPTPIEIVVRRVVEAEQEGHADFNLSDEEFEKLVPLVDTYMKAVGLKPPTVKDYIRKLLGW